MRAQAHLRHDACNSGRSAACDQMAILDRVGRWTHQRPGERVDAAAHIVVPCSGCECGLVC